MKTGTIPEKNYFNFLTVSPSNMASKEDIFMKEFASPSIDHICYLSRPTITAVKSLWVCRKCLWSLDLSSSMAANFYFQVCPSPQGKLIPWYNISFYGLIFFFYVGGLL